MAGMGYETYPSTSIEFLNIPNIHAMRSSLNKLRSACDGGSLSGTKLDECGWLGHIRTLLLGSRRVCSLVEGAGVSVLVHCSDGWDRTSQLCSLAKLMLDPYYRTLEGFLVLLDMDWLSTGHKFGQRYGHMSRKYDDQERSPIFLQFLDATWQVLQQFPSALEFNEYLLLVLADQLFACEYGTFLYNNERERFEAGLHISTASLWDAILHRDNIDKFRNSFYDNTSSGVIYPKCEYENIKLWNGYYLRWCEVSATFTMQFAFSFTIHMTHN